MAGNGCRMSRNDAGNVDMSAQKCATKELSDLTEDE